MCDYIRSQRPRRSPVGHLLYRHNAGYTCQASSETRWPCLHALENYELYRHDPFRSECSAVGNSSLGIQQCQYPEEYQQHLIPLFEEFLDELETSTPGHRHTDHARPLRTMRLGSHVDNLLWQLGLREHQYWTNRRHRLIGSDGLDRQRLRDLIGEIYRCCAPGAIRGPIPCRCYYHKCLRKLLDELEGLCVYTFDDEPRLEYDRQVQLLDDETNHGFWTEEPVPYIGTHSRMYGCPRYSQEIRIGRPRQRDMLRLPRVRRRNGRLEFVR